MGDLNSYYRASFRAEKTFKKEYGPDYTVSNTKFSSVTLNELTMNTREKISKGQKKNINCTMDDVRGCFLGLPHSTTPAAETTNKI